MSKQAISVTLDADNITWLKGRTGASGARSVSELLDQLITAARQSRHPGPSRSVVGTVDIDPSDPLLTHADEVMRAMFNKSIGRPPVVKEVGPTYRVRRSPAKKQRG
jgi:hypothetical protein